MKRSNWENSLGPKFLVLWNVLGTANANAGRLHGTHYLVFQLRASAFRFVSATFPEATYPHGATPAKGCMSRFYVILWGTAHANVHELCFGKCTIENSEILWITTEQCMCRIWSHSDEPQCNVLSVKLNRSAFWILCIIVYTRKLSRYNQEVVMMESFSE